MDESWGYVGKKQRHAVRSRSLRSSGPVKQLKPKKPGRPKLAKGHAKAHIVPVRFNAELLARVERAARANGKNVSEWIRSTVDAATS
jgi:hypothetical protein